MATAMHAPSACPLTRFSPSAPASGADIAAFTSLLLQALPSTAMASLASPQQHCQQHLFQQQFLQHFQRSYQQTLLQLQRPLPSQVDGKELQPQGQTNMVTQRPHEWLSPDRQKQQLALVPGVGRVLKSDLVLLRAIHKGELDVDDENAPDMTVFSPKQLRALEAFFDTAKEQPFPLRESLVHETPLKEPQDFLKSSFRQEMRPPPGLEDVIRVVPRTARPVAR